MRFVRHLIFPNKSLLLLALYVALSGIMMNFSEPTALRGIRWALLNVTETLSGAIDFLSPAGDLEQQNTFLIRENFELRVHNQELREMVLENARMRELLSLKEILPLEYTAARVIAAGTETGLGSVILDVGEDDGLTVNMAVINADGLVGKIFRLSPSQAQVQLLQDRNAFVSARLENTREVGTIAWRGGELLEMQHILKAIPVDKGEQIVTSGLGKIYPEGIKIGLVVEVSSDVRGMFKNVKVRPAVDFSALEEVFVVRQNPVKTESD